MAKENNVRVYGQLVQDPKFMYRQNEEGISRCIIYLKVLSRYLNNPRSENLLYDVHVILTRNKEMIATMQQFHAGDMLDVKGVLCTREKTRKYICPVCGNQVIKKGHLTYIYPIHVMRVEVLASEQRALHLLREHIEISNDARFIGYLCNAPEYYSDGDTLKRAQYQIAVGRAYRILEDEADRKTDFPWVKTVGQQAENDAKHLTTGSMVYIRGSVRARDLERKLVCDPENGGCGAEFEVVESTMEIAAYSVEYIANWKHDEDNADVKENEAAEGADS